MSEFAGSLRERLVIQRADDVPDGGGGTQRLWRDVQSIWASVQPLPRDERRYGAHVASRMRYCITLRADGPLPADARLIWRGMILEIISVTDDPALPDRRTLIAERERDA